MFLLNSRLGLFTAALQGFNTLNEHPFSRSYGVILPSSLTRVLSLTLGFSPRLPVSVCGTGTHFLARGFSWQCGIRNFGTIIPSPSQLSLTRRWDLPHLQPNCLDAHNPTARLPYPPASPHHSNGSVVVQEYQPVIHRLRFSASA